jgi:hypothetical protein
MNGLRQTTRHATTHDGINELLRDLCATVNAQRHQLDAVDAVLIHHRQQLDDFEKIVEELRRFVSEAP